MVFRTIITALGGAIIGAVTNGVATSKANKIKIAALEKAAKDMKKATEEYSGEKGFEKMYQTGLDTASDFGTASGNELASQQFVPQGPGATGAGINSAAMLAGQTAGNAASEAAQSGFEQGMANQAALNAAEYNKQKAKTDLELQQANINYNVANQLGQSGLQAIGGAVSTAKDVMPSNIGRTYVGGNGKRGKPVVSNSNPLME